MDIIVMIGNFHEIFMGQIRQTKIIWQLLFYVGRVVI
jgi:hypothetical protein